MDKRYLLIIFILIFGCSNLFFISIHSDVVGTASVNFDNYTLSVPNGFNLFDNRGDSIIFHNSQLGLFVALYSMDSYNFTNQLNNIKNNSQTTILSSGNISVGDISVDSIYYTNIKDDGKSVNCSKFYFNKLNHSFRVEMEGFNYENDKNITINILADIVNSLRINYKQM